MSYSEAILMRRIAELRAELQTLSLLEPDLSSPLVLSKSREIDKLVVRYYRASLKRQRRADRSTRIIAS